MAPKNDAAGAGRAPRLALFPWGGVAEDYLGPIGIDRRTFAQETTGGWLFTFAEGLRRHGIGTTIFYHSAEVAAPERHINPRTGVATVYLPPTALYTRLRRWPGDTDDIHRPYRSGERWASPLQNLVRYFATARGAVAAALRAEGCTSILVQEYENPRFDVLIRLGRRLDLPVYATFQGAPPPATAIERRIRRRSIHRAAGFVVGSAPEAERLARDYHLPAERIARIPNPLDLDLWYPEPRAACRAALRLPEDALVLVSHGRIELHRKGLDLLLAAWRRLVAAHPNRDLRLHLIGSGQDDAALAQEIDRAPVPGLRWVRRYVNDRAEIRRELSAADAYVLASRHEGFPVAPLEALACDLPIVAADAPGVAEILAGGEQGGGILVPKDDTDALGRGIERILLDRNERARLAARARPHVEAVASLDAVGRRLASFLAEVPSHQETPARSHATGRHSGKMPLQ
jgi:glycosyltransferase involved in cell wall biosynthesis